MEEIPVLTSEPCQDHVNDPHAHSHNHDHVGCCSSTAPATGVTQVDATVLAKGAETQRPWTEEEKAEINQMLGKARYKEKMRRLRALRGGKQRLEMTQQKQAEKKGAITTEKKAAALEKQPVEKSLHKAKVARGKKKLQKKAAADKEKQQVFVVDGGEGKDKIAFHLDDDDKSE